MRDASCTTWFTGTPKIGSICAAALLVAGGCNSAQPGPDVLAISPAAYGEAFDAALDVARKHGMAPAVRDRRRGVIETDPAVAGSLLEPWKPNATFDSAVENTIEYQRRRARFEFTPAGEADDDSEAPPRMDGPDLLSLEQTHGDLLAHAGDMELRVWVYVERNYEPGLRRSTWSRGQTTRAVIVPPDPDDPPYPREYWVPVSRDSAYERRLLEQVRRSLAAAD